MFAQCQHFGCLLSEDGNTTNQSIPVVLAVTTEDKTRLEGSSAITLTYQGAPVAIMRRPQFYGHRKEERCCRQFATNHHGHPYIKVRFLMYVLSRRAPLPPV